MKIIFIAAVILAMTYSTFAQMPQKHHEMCCSSCNKSFTHAHHLKHSCMRGCRLYGMIFLAHDNGIKDAEVTGMCKKSCNKGFSGMLGGSDARKACERGCTHQETVFQKHKVSHNSAKMSVLHGLTILPLMRSSEPFHQQIFQQMRFMHQRMMRFMHNAKNVAMQRVHIRIQSMAPGPDGKPRYHVEVHQYPLVIGHQLGEHKHGIDHPELDPGHHKHGHDHHKHGHDHHKHGHDHHKHGHDHHKHGRDHHKHEKMMRKGLIEINGKYYVHDVLMDREPHHHSRNVLHKIGHFFRHMPEGAKMALRMSLCGLLLLSMLGLLWMCCSTFRAARPRPRLSLTKAFLKKPSVQSGDIFYVDVDKKPLIEEDYVEKEQKDEA